MWPPDVFSEPVWQRLTWTLLHFLWQGVAVAGALVAALWLFRVRQARARYVLSLLAMVLMAACPLVTFAVMEVDPGRHAEMTDVARGADVAEEGPGGSQRSPISVRHQGDNSGQAPVSHPRVESPEPEDPGPENAVLGDPAAGDRPVVVEEAGLRPSLRLSGYARTVQPCLLLGWIAGVTLLGVRLLLAQAAVHWLRRGRCPICGELSRRVAELAQRLGLRSAVRVFGCRRVGEAIVVGLLRPMVLLPACWLAEMTPEVLEAVVAHELAHIRRWDLWVNLLQRLVETLLFYHPAVWWLSRRVRLEREMCCDELAVAATGERAAYATALELAARRRAVRTKPLLGAAMGGTKMRLLGRVRYVLGLSPARQRARWWPVGILALLVPLTIWLTSTEIAPPGQPEVRAAEQKVPTETDVNLELKQSARLAVTLELTALHFRTWEGSEAAGELAGSLIDGLQKNQGSNPWKVRIFPPDPTRTGRAQLDKFEVEALGEIKTGKDEVWRRAANGETRYARAIRATDGVCVDCHTMTGSPARPKEHPLKENDILGVASLTLRAAEDRAPAKPEAVPGPTAPYRVEPFDLLTIKALGTLPECPIDQTYFVDPAGQAALGVPYGRVQLKGMTLEEAEGAIRRHLLVMLRDPVVQVTRVGRVRKWHSITVSQASGRITPPTFLKVQVIDKNGPQVIDGRLLVDPSGWIALGPAYGKVNVKGLTIEQAEEDIRKHLEKSLDDPAVSATLESEWKKIVSHDVLPTSPHRITSADLLDIQVLGTLADHPIRGTHLLEPSGLVAFGPAYGRVRLNGLTLEEAEAAIRTHLLMVLREPVVSVTLAGWKDEEELSDDKQPAASARDPYRVEPFDLLTIKALGTLPDYPIDGVYLVEPSGRVALGPAYGRAQLKGLTLEQAESAIEKQLRQILSEPKVQVTSAGRVTRWRSAVLPKAPYRIRPNDSVDIRVAGTLPDHPIDGPYAVEPSGQVPLGPKYGRVRLGGLTLEEAEDALEAHLEKSLREPKASVTMEGWKSTWRDTPVPGPPYRISPGELLEIRVAGTLRGEPIEGIHLVEPSGKVALGLSYGKTEIKGLTLQEAETAIEKHLKKVLRDPRVSVTPAGWKDEEQREKTSIERRGSSGPSARFQSLPPKARQPPE